MTEHYEELLLSVTRWSETLAYCGIALGYRHAWLAIAVVGIVYGLLQYSWYGELFDNRIASYIVNGIICVGAWLIWKNGRLPANPLQRSFR